tara:strand:- start:3089 stop:3832 length:744 start_codon:yes stop_codon:yes gene_type:complete
MPKSINPNYIGKSPEFDEIKQLEGKFDTQMSSQQININTSDVIPDISTNPLNIYVPSTFNDTTKVWEDYMGNNNSSSYRGSPSYTTGSSSNNATNITEWVQGNTSAGLRFSHTTCSSGYTGFTVTRYNGTEGRIWEGKSGNWLSGHWSGNCPVAYHEGWLTDQGDRAGTSWIVTVDQYNYFRGYYNGTSYGGTGGSNSNSSYWCLNAGDRAEDSDWACYGFWYYNTTLGTSDRDQVVSYIKNLVGIS